MDQKLLNAIKERVAKATPGQWEIAYDTDDRDHVVDIWFDGEENGHAEIHDNSFGNAPYNAKFISHAREDVPALVSEVERLQKRLVQTEKCYEIMEKATFKASDKLKSFREALEFYANKNSHFRADMYAESTVMQDAGKIARQALGGEVHE